MLSPPVPSGGPPGSAARGRRNRSSFEARRARGGRRNAHKESGPLRPRSATARIRPASRERDPRPAGGPGSGSGGSRSARSTAIVPEASGGGSRPLRTLSRMPDFWSKTLAPTLREAPADAEVPSHQLMLRAGLVRRLGSGSYGYLPLGLRSLRKVEAIIREEQHAAGAVEVSLPCLQPISLWEKTGRREAYGPNLFVVQDRHGREAALAPTAEEAVADLVGSTLSSYKDLPRNVYQIQTKFRDEFRPRFGVLRSREFLMKDGYSFHAAPDGEGGLDETYQAQYAAYERIFERCGLDYAIVEAETGEMGGRASHQFTVLTPTGEDTVFRSTDGAYAANEEKAATGERPSDLTKEPTGDLEEVETPGVGSIEEVTTFFKKQLGSKLAAKNTLKTLVCVMEPGEESEAVESADRDRIRFLLVDGPRRPRPQRREAQGGRRTLPRPRRPRPSRPRGRSPRRRLPARLGRPARGRRPRRHRRRRRLRRRPRRLLGRRRQPARRPREALPLGPRRHRQPPRGPLRRDGPPQRARRRPRPRGGRRRRRGDAGGLPRHRGGAGLQAREQVHPGARHRRDRRRRRAHYAAHGLLRHRRQPRPRQRDRKHRPLDPGEEVRP